MDPYLLNERWEYDIVTTRGFQPLVDTKNFRMNINLRVEIQKEMFGGNNMQDNEKFFRWVWKHKPHICEETLRPLRNYSAVYCSHILTRGAYPEMAHDPRNINILCFEMHNRWENGDRENMRIYHKNLQTIETLKREYESLTK